MEILIFGVILVALMVFVSTKIKKSAASAFEREIVEGEDFTLVKPDGFISPINENSKFVFEAYTKEFGKNDADEFRQMWTNLIISPVSDFETAIESIENNDGEILSKKISEDAGSGQKICLIESKKVEKNVVVRVFRKIIESSKNRRIYHLQISILDAYREEYTDRLNEMLESFAVK